MENLTALSSLRLEGNIFGGDVPQKLCENLEEKKIGNKKKDFGLLQGYHFSSDCGGDISAGLLNCTCCTRCFDGFSSNVPVGECQGVNVTIVLELNASLYSREYQWHLIDGNASTPLLEGLYSFPNNTTETQTYNACLSPTSCFTFDSGFETDRSDDGATIATTIYANGQNIISSNDTTIKFGFSSTEETLVRDICDPYTVCGAPGLEGSIRRTTFNTLTALSGFKKVSDTTTVQHRAACWVIDKQKLINDLIKNKVDLERKNRQYYVLALINYLWKPWDKIEPPSNDICRWDGVECNSNHDIIAINFSGKNLTGTLPLELGSLQTLQSLRLDHNEFHGTVPMELGSLFSLKELYLGNNSFDGTISNKVFELPNMEVLDVTRNKISGAFPTKYASTLRVLDMSNNHLAGEIQISDALFPSLEHLELGANFFKGTIPVELSLASKLKTLHLQGNGLSGQIPDSLSDLTNLAELFLQDNDLTGNIPTSLGMLTNLNMLLLSYNAIEGPIPQEFQQLTSISKMFLHGTKLTGEAPSIQGNELMEFVSDCGSPSISLSPLICASCTVCCNTDNECKDNESKVLSLTYKTFIFVAAVIVILILFMGILMLLNKKKIIGIPELERNVGTMVGGNSSFLFLITKSPLGRCLSLTTAILQVAIFFIFINASNDRQYTIRCSRNRLDCTDEADVDWIAWTVFSLLMIYGPIKDIINGMMLSYKGAISKRFWCALSGVVLVVLGTLAIWASVFYLQLTATSNTELIEDSVILVIITDMDEKVFDLLKTINPTWVEKMRREAEMYSDELNAADNDDSDNDNSETDGGLCGLLETTTSEHTKNCTYADDMVFPMK